MSNNQQWINWTVEIEFTAPFHIGSGLAQGKLVDALVVADKNGLPYVPGSSVKGRVKSYFNQLLTTISNSDEKIRTLDNNDYLTCSNQDKICKNVNQQNNCLTCRVFGSGFTPGQLIFSDCKLADEELIEFIKENGGIDEFKDHLKPVRNGNRVNRRLKTTEPGALFNYQQVNSQYKYQGEISGKVSLNDQELKILKHSIELITHLGAKNSRGLGRCNVSIREEE
ncbi:MAG: RAMP superfamily CRISPR-associated protein [Bacillota bacterium]